MNIRELFQRALSGTLIAPSVTTSLGHLRDPQRPNITQLLGFVPTPPEADQTRKDDSNHGPDSNVEKPAQ